MPYATSNSSQIVSYFSVQCSAFDLILIPFVLPLLAHYNYHTSIKKSHGFRSFSYAAALLWYHPT